MEVLYWIVVIDEVEVLIPLVVFEGVTVMDSVGSTDSVTMSVLHALVVSYPFHMDGEVSVVVALSLRSERGGRRVSCRKVHSGGLLRSDGRTTKKSPFCYTPRTVVFVTDKVHGRRQCT